MYKQENGQRVKKERRSFSCGGILELARPFAGRMEDADQLHNIVAHAIGNYVRRSRDHQFAGAGYPAGPTKSRKMFERVDRFYDRSYGPGGSIGIVQGYVLGHGYQVRACRSQPLNAHVESNVGSSVAFPLRWRSRPRQPRLDPS